MQSLSDDELPESHGNQPRKISQSATQNAMKASVQAKKDKAAKFRRALKKSNILKIKLWQNTLTRSEEKPRLSPLPSNCLKILPRLSPDITSTTNYRYITSNNNSSSNNNVSSNRNQICSSSNSSESSHHHRHMHSGSEEDDEDEEDDEKAQDSDSSGQSSVKTNKTGSLISSSNKGDAVADDVEDYIRSGKPIRAAAVAALEAVHGRSLSEEALIRLRKAYTMKPSLPKGRGRRTIAKRGAARPIRAPQRMSRSITCESLIHRNCYYQYGDIICITNHDKPYFLQIQTLFKDWKEGAYASSLWLTPKKGCKRHLLPFNPMNFDLRRDLPFHNAALDEVKHVMHCPLDYFDGHPSYWNPRPGIVYMRLGEPLVKFVALEQPKKVETTEVPKDLDNINAEPALVQIDQDKEDIEMDLEVEQISNRNRNVDENEDENVNSSTVPDISDIRHIQRDNDNDSSSNSS